MVIRRIAFALLTLALATPAFSQVTSATAAADSTHYLVGDYINYKIEVGYRKGSTVYPPSVQDSLKNLTLIRTEKPVVTQNGNQVTEVFSFILSCYDSAGVTIPPIPVLYRASGDTSLGSVSTNPVGFTVSTLPVDMKSGIKGVKSPIAIPFDWRWLILWIAAALLVLGLAYYLYRRYRRKKASEKSVAPVVKVPPHERALNALRELDGQQLWQRGLVKEYHSGITEIIRRYFEERFSMPAMELPTSEAVEELKRRPESEPVWDLTYSFLSNADMVKFAKFNPMGSVNEEMMKQAYEIVGRTAPSADSQRNGGTANVQ